MIIESLSVKNFRTFYGEHEINLAPVGQNKFTVIFGENMSGKTSLFLAINWCLYEKALGRLGELIRVFSPGTNANNYLINVNALDAGDYEVSVCMKYSHNGRKYDLRRMTQCQTDPTKDQFESTAFLTREGNVVQTASIPERIGSMLPLEASQFTSLMARCSVSMRSGWMIRIRANFESSAR